MQKSKNRTIQESLLGMLIGATSILRKILLPGPTSSHWLPAQDRMGF
jgi:hypothetical protein